MKSRPSVRARQASQVPDTATASAPAALTRPTSRRREDHDLARLDDGDAPVADRRVVSRQDGDLAALARHARPARPLEDERAPARAGVRARADGGVGSAGGHGRDESGGGEQ
jgi:hypothetical protein